MNQTSAIGVSCALLLTGCGTQVGEECHFSGSGFSLRDPCRSKCLELWTVNCPDGTAVQPAMCAGSEGCSPGSCPAGQACYTFEDPFDEVAYCVPVQACPYPPVTTEAVHDWELSSQQTASALREKFGKFRRATDPLPEPGEP